jgi:hypothetical protein
MKPQAFILDFNPAMCAQDYCDEHLVEYAPILIEVLRATRAEKHPFKNHILTKWCGGSSEYAWLWKLAKSMLKEVEYRFGIEMEELAESLFVLDPPADNREPRRWLQLIPKPISGKPVEAYQQFYLATQQGSTWTKRQVPKWFTGAVQQSLF